MTTAQIGIEPGLVTPEPTPAAEFSAENHATQLIAQLAKKGHHVSRLDGGGFLVANWGYSLHCPGLPELQGFARKVGVQA